MSVEITCNKLVVVGFMIMLLGSVAWSASPDLTFIQLDQPGYYWPRKIVITDDGELQTPHDLQTIYPFRTVFISFAVWNQGDGYASSFSVKVEDTTTGKTEYVRVDGLDPAGGNNIALRRIQWRFTQPGQHILRVTADCYGADCIASNDDRDRSDNTEPRTITVYNNIVKKKEISGVPLYVNDPEKYTIPGCSCSGGICVATAAADILAYWDLTPYKGITYWNLVGGQSDVAPLRDTSPPNQHVADLVKELGKYYYVDHPFVDADLRMQDAIEYVANTLKCLDFTVTLSDTDKYPYPSKSSLFQTVRTEIDNGRPALWGVDSVGEGAGHAMPVIGYVDLQTANADHVFVHVNLKITTDGVTDDGMRDEYINWYGGDDDLLDVDTDDVVTIVPGGTPGGCTVSTPTFSLNSGTYPSTQTVTINCATTGATIRYTTNGSDPIDTSPQYTGPLSINATTTLKAKAWKTGWNPSGVKSATYTITGTLPTPTFSPDNGTYTSTQTVTISCSTAGATIRYTTNGNDPVSTSTQYTGPISINSTTRLKAKAWKTGWNPSGIKSALYTINHVGALTVTINPQTVRDAGARWRVDTGTWRSSGYIESNIPIGSHTVEFNNVSNWIKPASQTVTVSAGLTKTATGTYVPVTYILTVTAVNGTAALNPNKTTYTQGESVTLTATPNTGYVFTGWSGGLSGSTNPATLTMNANKMVTANFALKTYTLTVNATNGAVSRNPNKATYTQGETVTLTATPSTGYVFTGWSGDLSGSANPDTITMDADKTVTANFEIPEEPVFFADLNLKAAVEVKLGMTDPTPTQMRALTSLSAGSKGITDLTGLEHATNLKAVSLYGNQIRDISDVAGLTSLTYLYLSKNQISDISAVKDLRNLTSLYLYNNQISDISDVAGLTSLTTLSLYSNQISDISAVKDLTSLTTLSLPNNQISDISDVAGLTNLTTLSLSNNQISDISDVVGLTSLTDLDLSDNQISDISAVEDLTNLTSLSLYSNQISDISDVAGLTSLTDLDLSDNQIGDISAVEDLTNLTSLNLYNNQIGDISWLNGLTNLTRLYLSGNHIEDISPLGGIEFPIQEIGEEVLPAPSGLFNLEELVLSNNDINDISVLSGLGLLKKLRLHGNEISDISGLTHLDKLTHLNLRGNPLDADSVNVDIPKIRQTNPGVSLFFGPLKIMYVNVSAPYYADGDGSSYFAEAIRSLQDALALAADSGGVVKEIRVYPGTYTPDSSRCAVRGDRSAAFNLVNGVKIIGGYGGETILSGDLYGNDVRPTDPKDLLDESTRSDNSYTVVNATDVSESAVLENVTITGGHAVDLSEHSHWSTNANGGGLFIDSANPRIVDCNFIYNTAWGDGGAVAVWAASPTLEYCRFEGNVASGSGGGMSGAVAQPYLTHCTFIDNWADAGGALYLDSSEAMVHNTAFTANRAADSGGAMFNLLSGPDLIGCIFSGNTCAQYGGAVYNFGYHTTTVTNCTFTGNVAANGSGMACDSPVSANPCKAKVVNTILWDGGLEIWSTDDAQITIDYGTIWGGWPTGIGNLQSDPKFVQTGYWDLNATPQDITDDFWIDGNYDLKPDSPCIDAGDPDYVADPNETDINGHPRIFNGRIDIGADEYAP